MHYGNQSPSRDHHVAEDFDVRIGQGLYVRSRSNSPTQRQKRSESPETVSSHKSGLQAAMEILRNEETKNHSHSHKHQQHHQHHQQHQQHHERRHDTKYVGGVNSPTGYAYTHPCTEEEYEARMEKKRSEEALERLRKKLHDEREAGKDPHYNDTEDDGYLRTIFDGHVGSASLFQEFGESKGQGGGQRRSFVKGATSEDVRREPKSKKIPDVPILQRSRGPNEGPNIINGVICLKHGKSGNPKSRRIIYDPPSMEIRWKPNSENVSIFDRMYTNPPQLPSNQMAPGIKIGFINKVVKGIHTDRLLKAKLVDPACCMSIITNDRTLDLTLSSQHERNAFFATVKSFLNERLANAHHRVEFSS